MSLKDTNIILLMCVTCAKRKSGSLDKCVITLGVNLRRAARVKKP